MSIEQENDGNLYAPSRYFLGIRLSALIEIGCFFLVLFLLSFFLGIGFNYFNVCPHPFWILIILIAAQYGTIEALIAAVVSTLVLIAGQTPERDVFQEHFEYVFLLAKTPIQWFIAAVILGELRMRHIRERDALREIVLKSEEDKAKIAEAYEGLKKIKESLELHAATDYKTALAVLSSFKKLENLNENELIKGTLELVKTLVNPDLFSLYLMKDNSLKYMARWGERTENHYARSFGPETALFQAIVKSKELVFVHSHAKILEYEGVAAVPIIDVKKDIVYGMIKIEKIPFIFLKPVNLNELQKIGELVGIAYSNFFSNQEKNEN